MTSHRKTGLLSALVQHLSAAPFPERCLLCDAPGSLLCAWCTEEAQAGTRMACKQCGVPLRHSGTCGACLHHPPAFDTTIAAAIYDAPFDQLVLGLKFHAQLSHANLFARLLLERVLERMPEIRRKHHVGSIALDLLIPVPLNSARLSQRGFNQALEIARPLGQYLGVRVEAEIGLRILDTPHQASLPMDARNKNVRAAFALSDGTKLHGLHVGVIDDVMTTGATLNEFAKVLKAAGALTVTNLVVARTP